MKKIILLFILGLLFKSSNAQQFYPFPTSNAFWLDWVSTGPNEDPGWCANFQHTIVGDTTIGSNVYHKLEESRVYYFHPYIGICVFDSAVGYSLPAYQGAFREDVASKKIYYVEANNSNEVLMYDFDLNVGDTMFTQLTAGCGGFPITDIDSVQVGGSYHKRFNCTSCGFTSFIEGVGSTDGLFATWCSFTEFGQSLICFNVNNLGVYPDGSSCNPLVLEVGKVPGEDGSKIFPDPSDGLVHLRFSNKSSERNISIFNSLGEQLIEKQIIENESDFDLRDYPKGVYFLKVITGNKISFQKFILI